jgi:hypothetical protein
MRQPAITLRRSKPAAIRAASFCLLLHLATPAFAGDEAPAAPTVWLRGDAIELEVSPRLGGRVLQVFVPGAPNLLRVGDAVREQPDPKVDGMAGDIGYLGHQLWVGPQGDWWRDQEVNRERLAQAAVWPPDPWLAYAPATVLEHASDRLRLQGVDSPVSGVRLDSSYAILPQRPDTLALDVRMHNVRERPVAHDIWFNTRVHADTRVFVPVTDAAQARIRSDIDADYDGLVGATGDGIFSLELPAPDAGKSGRRGKVFIQPSAGWMAGFSRGQAFLVRFELQPRERIHPEHGQIELYQQWRPDAPADSLLEMEVHGPYVRLAPGEATSAREWWTVRRYAGPETRDAQLAFLRAMLDESELQEAGID